MRVKSRMDDWEQVRVKCRSDGSFQIDCFDISVICGWFYLRLCGEVG